MTPVRTRFSANLNKFALIRNSRGKTRPDLIAIARSCLKAGVDGITVHPRIDQRHIKYDDVLALAATLREHPGAELNVEGAIEDAVLDLVLEVRPSQCTLVPDTPNQLTSDHGWEVIEHRDRLRSTIERLHRRGIRVSLFVDATPEQAVAARSVGADRVELYTESYAVAYGTARQGDVVRHFRAATEAAQRVGLGVNAGHDLSLDNLGAFLDGVPGILEVSVGHAFVCESLDFGTEETIRRYLAIVEPASRRVAEP